MNLKILIADDVGFVRELLIEACESLGYTIIGEATDGDEAIHMALKLRPDVIIMDLVMPKYNGLEATERILEVLPATDIIACSSMDDRNTLRSAMARGCKAFLRKPFNRQSLMSVFQQIEIQRTEVKHA